MFRELNELMCVIHNDNVAKGFYDDEFELLEYIDDPSLAESYVKSVKAQRLMLMVSELSEALEADRKDLMDDKLTKYKGFDVELADAIIRILDTCGRYKINIGKIIEEKLEYNRSREYKHGKAY